MHRRILLRVLILFLCVSSILPLVPLIPIKKVYATSVTKSPSAYENSAWALPQRAYSSDDLRAYESTHLDAVTYKGYNFQNDIPDGSTIDNVYVKGEGYVTSPTTQWVEFKVSWDGGSTWSSTWTKFSFGTSDYLSSHDVTSHTSWTRDKLSETNFRVKIRYAEGGGGCYPNQTYFLSWNDTVVADNLSLWVLYANGSLKKDSVWDNIAWSQVDRVGIRNQFGVGGFSRQYGNIVWYPYSQPDGKLYDEPLWYGYIRFAAKVGSSWYYDYITKNIAKTPQFREVKPQSGKIEGEWEVGWNGTVSFGNYNFPVYVGLRATRQTPSMKIKTNVTSPLNLQNHALVYHLVMNPYWNDFAKKKVKWVRVHFLDGSYRDYDIQSVIDWTASIPQTVYSFTFLNELKTVEINTFDFSDVFSQAVNRQAKIEQMTLPNGQQTYAITVVAFLGELNAGQTVSVDPAFSFRSKVKLQPWMFVDVSKAKVGDKILVYDDDAGQIKWSTIKQIDVHTGNNWTIRDIYSGEITISLPNRTDWTWQAHNRYTDNHPSEYFLPNGTVRRGTVADLQVGYQVQHLMHNKPYFGHYVSPEDHYIRRFNITKIVDYYNVSGTVYDIKVANLHERPFLKYFSDEEIQQLENIADLFGFDMATFFDPVVSKTTGYIDWLPVQVNYTPPTSEQWNDVATWSFNLNTRQWSGVASWGFDLLTRQWTDVSLWSHVLDTRQWSDAASWNFNLNTRQWGDVALWNLNLVTRQWSAVGVWGFDVQTRHWSDVQSWTMLLATRNWADVETLSFDLSTRQWTDVASIGFNLITRQWSDISSWAFNIITRNWLDVASWTFDLTQKEWHDVASWSFNSITRQWNDVGFWSFSMTARAWHDVSKWIGIRMPTYTPGFAPTFRPKVETPEVIVETEEPPRILNDHITQALSGFPVEAKFKLTNKNMENVTFTLTTFVNNTDGLMFFLENRNITVEGNQTAFYSVNFSLPITNGHYDLWLFILYDYNGQTFDGSFLMLPLDVHIGTIAVEFIAISVVALCCGIVFFKEGKEVSV